MELALLIPGISKSSIQEISKEKLRYRKVCTENVPKMATEVDKRQRVVTSQELFERYVREKIR